MEIPDQQLIRCPCCGETFHFSPDQLVAAPPTSGSSTAQVPVLLVFDGGSRGNPGPGYGSYQLTVRGKTGAPKRVELGDNYTSNEAEYDTLIRALEEVQRRAKDPGAVRLEIRGDSQLVIKQITRAWKVKQPRLQVRAARVWELLASFGAWTADWHPRARSVEAFGH